MAEAKDQEQSGLQYLSAVRPEAMQHLLAFFGESGRHLDPRTRFLISVVTKVINFSPRGLRQYIPRAMREGASRDQVIDAILCAYPAAGLTKVVDAINVLRSLDLSAFEAGRQAGREPGWKSVLCEKDLPPGRAGIVEVGGQRIALFNHGGEFCALANSCLHQGGSLGEGTLEGEVVRCPRHGWRFNIRSGACLGRPQQAVETFEVRVEKGEVQLRV